MPLTHHRFPLAVVTLAALVALLPSVAMGQTPTPSTMVIEVPDPDQPEYLPGTTNLAYFGQRFAVFADGTLCVEGDVPTTGGFIVVLGEAGQPSECGTPGTRVEFAGTLVGPFTFETKVALGSTVVLTNWGPYPTHTPYPTHVCAWLADGGSEALAGCAPQATPGPSDAGNAGPRLTPDDGAGVMTALLMLALTLAGAVSARAVARRP